MGSDTSRSVGTVGATNRTVVPITVMARIWLANSQSPVGSDAASPIDAIDTSGCVAWLGKHERAKCSHDASTGMRYLAKPCVVYTISRYLLDSRSARIFRHLLIIKSPVAVGFSGEHSVAG